MPYENSKDLDNIDECLIIRKITEIDPSSVASNEELEAKECVCFTPECECERYMFLEEQNAIIRKQLQMLQADERGKQALISEIAALKQSQEQKAELLRHRQHARSIENERARKIASLPPPLPKTVKLLLKKSDDEPKTNKPDVQMPDELKTVKIKPVEPSKENKENILDPEELEAQLKMQEEWQLKANKRFNEALRKDRQKKEYSNIMKQIQSAELQNRREMSKNVSFDKTGIPCLLSDKFQISKKQTDMEEAAEKLFKKISNKEHAIEDVEGYQDLYESKYKRIDSNYESKMIDCIPEFIKENCEYLLDDESKFQGGKNFSEFDRCSDILNEAYIESPPGFDELDGNEKIDQDILYLDKLRSDNQTEYEEILKPLLIAAMEGSKKNLIDKAVETESIQVSAEDKSVETDVELTSPSPPPMFDFTKAGIMSYKRRHHGPILNSYQNMIPDMHKRHVLYTVPSTPHSEGATASWSSSSYCSLPSKHGFPTLSEAEAVKCDICIAEMKDTFVKEIPCEISPSLKKTDKSTVSSRKAPLSKYVQQLAEKYLIPRSSVSSDRVNETVPKSVSDSVLRGNSKIENVTPAFEKEVICKPKESLFVGQPKSQENLPTSEKGSIYAKNVTQFLPPSIEEPDVVARTKVKIIIPNSEEINPDKARENNFKDDIYSEIKNYESSKSPVEYSDYDLEVRRRQAIHEVLSRRLPQISVDLSPNHSESKELESLTLSTLNRLSAKPYVFHELSTIQEMDSALTAGSLHLSHSNLSDISRVQAEKEIEEKRNEDLAKSAERLNMISLLDPPDPEISEMAKSIHFVEAISSAELPKSGSSEGLNVLSVSSKDSSSTPSHITDSGSSVSSHEKVFSSTLSGNRVKHPDLKDTKVLPLYFKNVSSIKKILSSEKSSSSEFIDSSSVSSCSLSLPSVIQKKDVLQSKVSGHNRDEEISNKKKSGSYLITPCSEHTGFTSSAGSFKALTPHSNVSSPSQLATHAPVYQDLASSIESFKPLTPHSNVSSPTQLATHAPVYQDLASSTESFRALTPHSNVSSVVSATSAPEYQPQGFVSSTENFRALTPHSNISSPSELNAIALEYKKQTVFSSSKTALTPFTNISSSKFLPHDSRHECQTLGNTSPNNLKAETCKKFSANSESRPIMIRLDISTDSISSNNESPELKKLSCLRYHLALKAELPSSNDMQQPKIPSPKQSTLAANEKQSYKNASEEKVEIKEGKNQEIKTKGRAHTCSSESFIPHIDNLLVSQNVCNLVEGTLTTDYDENESQPHSTIDSKMAIISSDRSKNEGKLLESKGSGTVSTSSCEEILARNTKGNLVSQRSKESNKTQNPEIRKDFKKQYGSLQAVSSTSSSSENLSEISASKVLCQSTPIKTFSEIIQEPGIMEEPDLTLVPDLSCKIDSPVKKGDPSTSHPAEYPMSKGKNITPSAIESKTPTSQSSWPSSSADTPSMLSFLQHEMSCLHTEASGVHLSTKTTSRGSSMSEEPRSKAQQLQEVKRSLFPKSEYKQRTKRLWKNLEEVRKKNMNEERKKLMEVNRIKAKEFAKKLTPRRKGK